MPLHAPHINPVLLHIWGPFSIRWYSVLYVGAFVLGRHILRALARQERFVFTAAQVDELILWLLLGAVIGARIVFCVVYDPVMLSENPLSLFKVYQGGLSFHGGLLGVVVALALFSRRTGVPFFNLSDACAMAGPWGLAMGRIGNFINGELFGRVSYVPWAMVFPSGGPLPRHPSQLYECALEGLLLGSVLWGSFRFLRRPGQLTFLFLMGYTLARFTVEFFREPDVQVGYLALGLTMGQWLSLVMFFVTAGSFWYVGRKALDP